jgi:hypothetical protein
VVAVLRCCASDHFRLVESSLVSSRQHAERDLSLSVSDVIYVDRRKPLGGVCAHSSVPCNMGLLLSGTVEGID